MRIDARQHYWQISRDDYGWITPEVAVLYRDFLPRDLRPQLDVHHIDGTIVVQAAPVDLLVKSPQLPALLELLALVPNLRGVVDHIAKPGIRAQALHPWRAYWRDRTNKCGTWLRRACRKRSARRANPLWGGPTRCRESFDWNYWLEPARIRG